MSRRTREQQRAIDLMAGWGWHGLVAQGNHFVRIKKDPFWKWCAISIIRYAEDPDGRDAGACPEHIHEEWA